MFLACLPVTVILLPVYPASFMHNFVSGMQSFYFSESKDAKVLQNAPRGAFCNTFDLHSEIIGLENQFLSDLKTYLLMRW